jgi:hypothetical protein
VSVLTVYIIRPRLRRMLRSGEGDAQLVPMLRALLFFLRVNPALGAGVLLATSVMFYYPVPFGFGPPGPSSYTVQRSGITAVVSITPDKSGENQMRVVLTNQKHRPLSQAAVRVLTTMLDMPMGTGVVPLNEQGQSGVFTGPVELAMGGRWRLIVLVYQPNGYTQLAVDVRVAL